MTTDLYALLPATHRLRDAELGSPLRALMEAIGEQLQAVETDLDRLYDNWFIETGDEWVVSYLGDLLGVPQLAPTGDLSGRAAVANTLSYRRRKGTAAVLERLSSDLAAWPATVVEFYRRLATTQHLNHLRPSPSGTLDLRDSARLELLGGPFDPAARFADGARITVRSVGLYACRLGSYPVTGGTARPVPGGPGRYTFSPLGDDQPLFNVDRPDAADPQLRLPLPLRRRALHKQIPEGVLRVSIDGEELPPEQLAVCHLADWRPPGGDARAAVDPELGRITLPPTARPGAEVTVDYAYGFPGELGGGPYDRLDSLEAALAGREPDRVLPVGADAPFTTLAAAITAWNENPGRLGVIALGDSRSYPQTLPEVVIPEESSLLVIAARETPSGLDPRGLRPHLRADLAVSGGAGSSLALNGLLIEGTVLAGAGRLGRLSVTHCTLVPGLPRPSVEAQGSELAVTVERSITGLLSVPDASELVLRESIVDAGDGPAIAAGAMTAEAVTVLCAPRASRQPVITARTLEASNCLFTGIVAVQRRQTGCVRFSYVPPGSTVPRRFHNAETPPRFTSTRYGDPAYGRLARDCPDTVARGGDDGAEMGALGFLHQPQRLDNLSAGLREHTPFGVAAAIIFIT